MLYFDCASTYRPIQKALDAYMEVTATSFGNSASLHAFGQEAGRVLEGARASILKDLRIESTHRLVFTSGASEANNMAIKSTAFRYANRGKKILVSSVEHPSVSKTMEQLATQFGFEVVFVPVDETGVVTPEILAKYMDNTVILVSMMAVNNETGAIFPIEKLASVVHKFPKAFFHSDLTQAIGKVALPYSSIDLGTFSGHKFGALKGSGGLFYKKTMVFTPLVSGGEQEFGIRGGTVNVAGAKALSVALHEAMTHQAENQKTMEHLSYILKQKMLEIDEIVLNSPANSSPYVTNFSFSSHKASVIIEALSEREIYCSSVSACSSKGEPLSDVLLAMGIDTRLAANSMRVSMPLETSEEDIAYFVETLKTILKEVRPL